jgi:glycosyltransferase involved in cell wall biosynthesis
VRELGIERRVAWIAPVVQHELIQLYNAADAVLDQFELGDFGGCAREAWACGTPVFIYLESAADMLGKEPPAINVRTEDEIYRALSEAAKDPRALRETGAASRQWLLENLHTDALAPRYIEAYREILGARG